MGQGEGGSALRESDPEIFESIAGELRREQEKINLIASENYASSAVLEAQGSLLTNKYAEGYPGRRYYPGCGPVDEVESVALARAKELFGCDHANVQPHAGAQANMIAYMAALEPGQTILAMDLRCGGHLTHGSPANFSGVFYRAVHYGVNRETEVIDYDEVAAIAEREKPRVIVAGASAYPRRLDFDAFRRIADGVGARLMVDMAHFGGLVVGGVHPDPVPVSDFVTGTTHKTMRGPRGGFVLCREEHASRVDAAAFPGVQGGPLMHAIAAKAVCFMEAMRPEFRAYQRAIVDNAGILCEKMASDGFRVVSGGTETHLFLVDLRPQGISGRDAQVLLESVGICANMNEIPYDRTPPTVTSGIRIGTPAVTSRGMRADEMRELGGLISTALKERDSEASLDRVRSRVRDLSEAFPVY